MGWGYVIMGWAGFSICHLLFTAAEGGRGSFGAGGTANKTCSNFSHSDTGGCSNGAPRSAGDPLNLFLIFIIFVLLPLIFS